MNLAMLAALGMTDIHAMNALKVVLAGIINAMAVITFIVAGARRLEAGRNHDRGRNHRRLLWRPLRPEATAGVDSCLRHRGGDRDDNLFLLESILTQPKPAADKFPFSP